jgi:hypothetical protein
MPDLENWRFNRQQWQSKIILLSDAQLQSLIIDLYKVPNNSALLLALRERETRAKSVTAQKPN